MSDTHNRVFGLDFLRAFAVICVVYTHGYPFIMKEVSENIYMLPVMDGVTMFFVLSGFLIGRILLRMMTRDDFNGRSLLDFWVRRWFRTLPNYFLVLVFLVVFIRLQYAKQPEDLSAYFFFLQNMATPHPRFFPEAWSLSVEEWFYLCSPIPLYFSLKITSASRSKIILLWIATIIIAVMAFRIYRAYQFGYVTETEWDAALRKQVVTRLDSLMLGVLGAYTSIYYAKFWSRAAKVGLLLGITLLLFDKIAKDIFGVMFYMNYFSLTVSAVGTLLLLPSLSGWRRNTGWLVSSITFLSLISYSLYLLNFTPFRVVLLPSIKRYLSMLCEGCDSNSWMLYLIYWIVVVLWASLLYRYFEKPMTALRDKWGVMGKAPVTAFESTPVNQPANPALPQSAKVR